MGFEVKKDGKELWFEGKLDMDFHPNGRTSTIEIGNSLFVQKLEDFVYSDNPRWDSPPKAKVTLMIQPEPREWEGKAFVDEGDDGYSSYTPGWSPEFTIGGIDILDELDEYDGREICLVVEKI